MKKLLVAALPLLSIASACSSSSSDSVEAFCSRSAAADQVFGHLGSSPSEDAQAISLFDDLTKHAPADIKGDMTIILNSLKTGTTPPGETSLSVASRRVVQYFKDKCHVDLGAPPGASGASASGSSGPNSAPN